MYNLDQRPEDPNYYSIAYKYSLKYSSWTTPNITGIDNLKECSGLQSIIDNTGRIFLYGGVRNMSGEICNKMSIFYTNNMEEYTATLLKGLNITYIDGRSVATYNDSSYVNMNEKKHRAGHSDVLTRDSKIIIYGGSKMPKVKAVNPDLAMLDINVYPFK
ncbi:hypothetical protein C2G38_2089675 [Gigaspora rosea]|uniref:Uncharacterized protein n=1 Tax=Gigaspora rosea TaxID=44941 RepID=A0A397V4D7_9GLOM|nr:hypothetical protein C2G38_2089675 [Gigaspora rosea]